jgi:DNA invertase Pin-like site-specific DNA recombinase
MAHAWRGLHLRPLGEGLLMQTLAYVRISTEGQEDGTGLDVQRNHIVADAANNGMQIDHWRQDIEGGARCLKSQRCKHYAEC